MKKKKTANLIMVLIIAAIAIAGVVTAFMLKTSTGDGLGSHCLLYTSPSPRDRG